MKIPTWVDPGAPQRIRDLAYPLEILHGWPGLADFLVAVAIWESRGVSSAVGDKGTSFGWFQLKAKSSRAAELGISVSTLKNSEPVQVALATWYYYRLSQPPWWPGDLGEITWLDLRRGGKYPKLVKDTGEKNAASAPIRHRFTKALVGAGLAPTFMYDRAFSPGFAWQGIDATLSAVGYGAIS